MNDPKTFLQPLGGYVLDVISKLRGREFVPHSLTKLHNINYARRQTGAKTAVEIGSFKGVTTKRLSYLFDKVVSVEIDEALCKHAQNRCRKRKNVTIHLGDGKEFLADIAPDTDKGLLFLDGHFSGGETGQGDEPEPILHELDVIQPHLDNFCALVIDDFRLFGVDKGWPHKSEVLAKLESVFDGLPWRLAVQYDQILVLRENAG